MNPSDPAFPVTYEDGMAEKFTVGLTKREYFAAIAMKGILSSHAMILPENRDKLAETACLYADAMIIELSK